MKSFPPIVQLLLTVQFQPAAASLSILDWGDLRRLFSDELPVFAQIPRAGAMPAGLGQFVLDGGGGLPRLSMTSSDLTNVLMVQDDRISVGWQRTSPLSDDPNYPGFSATLERATKIIQTILEFIAERATQPIQLSVGELAYIDAFLTHKDGIAFKKMEDIFTCFRFHDQFPFNAFNLAFHRSLAIERGDDFDGMAETTIAGFSPTPDGQATIQLQTVVRFDFSGAFAEAIPERYEIAHKIAESIFATLVKPEACAILESS